MGNEIQKFDVSEHIRNRVREVIVSSVPDEQMDLMIKKEYDAFFLGSENQFGRREESEF